MENKINIAELLKDCPKGMELNCIVFNNVKFQCVSNDGIWIEYIDSDNNKRVIHLTYYGGFKIKNIETNCVIFPKGKTTWEGFHRPFVDGDILATNDGKFVAIIKKNGGKYYCSCYTNGNYFVTDYSGWFDRFATEEEKAKLFQVIKDNGYRWNPETKTLEELPIFKVGDRIRHKNNGICCTLGEYSEGISAYRTNIGLSITHKDLEQWELVQNKFDIASLKPFDKVLVRNNSSETWHIQFFENYNRQYGAKYPFVCMCNKYSQCIPFKYNEHLVDTANNCDDYFKIWKDE